MVPLLQEDHDALVRYEHLAFTEGEVVRAFWRIGLRHSEEFTAQPSSPQGATVTPIRGSSSERRRLS
jgi:hypothetical protein